MCDFFFFFYFFGAVNICGVKLCCRNLISFRVFSENSSFLELCWSSACCESEVLVNNQAVTCCPLALSAALVYSTRKIKRSPPVCLRAIYWNTYSPVTPPHRPPPTSHISSFFFTCYFSLLETKNLDTTPTRCQCHQMSGLKTKCLCLWLDPDLCGPADRRDARRFCTQQPSHEAEVI